MVERDTEYLAALIEHRTEEPNVEYKSWMDLSNNENRAKIAKHICGLANFGGGYLIFGVEDDGSFAEPYPTNVRSYRQDVINGITGKYLTPAPHCNVHFVRASNDKEYPVVVVPSHGAQPVCAKSDGPLVNSKRVGVQQGIHYIRVAGPRTVAIDTPELWQQLIYRCVTKERDRLISAIGSILERPTSVPIQSSIDAPLDELVARWIELQPKQPWTVDLTKNLACYAFQLLDGEQRVVRHIELKALKDAVRRASHEAAQFKDSDLSAFAAIYDSSRCAVFVQNEDEGYEIQHLYSNGEYLMPPLLGRISVAGGGGEVRAYWEDTQFIKEWVEKRGSRNWEPATRLTPRYQVDRGLNLVAFVKSFAEEFADAKYALFAVDYRGLRGRIVADPCPSVYFSLDRKSGMPSRRTKRITRLDALTEANIAEVVASLVGPIFRLFDGWEVTAGYVLDRIRSRND